MNISKLTKPQLIERIAAQSAEIAALRAQLSEARVMVDALRTRRVERPATSPAYPLVDGLGRPYRIEMHGGRKVKCFAPGV